MSVTLHVILIVVGPLWSSRWYPSTGILVISIILWLIPVMRGYFFRFISAIAHMRWWCIMLLLNNWLWLRSYAQSKYKNQLPICHWSYTINNLNTCQILSLRQDFYPGLCSSRAWWPLAPNFCSRATRKSQIFHTNHMLGTQHITGSEHWAPFYFPHRTALLPLTESHKFWLHASSCLWTNFSTLVENLEPLQP